jgi:hypothetical protein
MAVPFSRGEDGYLSGVFSFWLSGNPNLAVKASTIISVMVNPFRLASAAQCLRQASGTLQHKFTSRSLVGWAGLEDRFGFSSFRFTGFLYFWFKKPSYGRSCSHLKLSSGFHSTHTEGGNSHKKIFILYQLSCHILFE